MTGSGKRCLACGGPVRRDGNYWGCRDEACRFEWVVYWGTGECGYWVSVLDAKAGDPFRDVPRGCLLVAGREES